MKSRFTLVFTIILAFAFSYCARESMPNGGPKDLTPPKVIGAEPGQNALNFNSNIIKLEFDEYVSLEDIENQLIISPYLEEKPKVFMRGKKVIIKLPENLDYNTTYTVNFGESIKDITEKNTSNELTYVFSTGDFIDTLMIRGQLFDAKEGNPVKDKRVYLYRGFEDSVIFKSKPNYVARTKENGIFDFKNLPFDDYQLFALDDLNGNLQYDKESESMAFYNELVNPEDSTYFTHKLFLFQQDKKTQLVNSYTKDSALIKLVLNNDVPIDIRDINDAATNFTIQKNYTNDTTYVFYEASVADKYEFELTNEGNVIDTISFKPGDKLNADSTFLVKPYKAPKQRKNNNIDIYNPYQFTSEYPVKTLNKNYIKLNEDSIEIKDFQVSYDGTLIDINHNWLPNTKYRLHFDEAAVVDILNRVSKKDSLILKSYAEDDYVDINMILTKADSLTQYIAQLYTPENRLIQEGKLDSLQITYESVLPGAYFIKVIEDLNENGEWDNGIYNYQQPERIISSGTKPFNVKAGVDLDLNLVVR